MPLNAPAPKNISEGCKLHPHVLLIHFPISFFISAFAFRVLHLFTRPVFFELATNASLAAGTAVLIPTVWSGWSSWRRNSHGAKLPLFHRKIAIAVGMLGVSFPLTVWRFAFFGRFADNPKNPWRWIYLAGNTLLIAGALAEGYYGGRLNHH